MITLEQVEELRKRTNISYDDAKKALEETNGDILEAIINLEKQNKIDPPKGGGFYSTKNTHQSNENNQSEGTFREEIHQTDSQSFGELMSRFFKWCGKVIDIGNRNNFEVTKDGRKINSLPVTILVLLLIFMFWLTIPMMIIGLFFGYRYSFSGPDLGKEKVNRAMDSVADVAESLKKEVKGDKTNGENSDN